MTYSEKAFEIVKQSVNSVVFIDDKAKEFYSDTPELKEIEEKLSVELFNGFKSEGISLAVHKFKVADIDNEQLRKYLLKDRDLVLLDWELEKTSGINHSLKLLSEVVEYPHINFCCIYTSTSQFDDINKHIEAYFSGYSKADYEKVKDEYSFLEEKDLEHAEKLLTSDDKAGIHSFLQDNKIDLKNFPIKDKQETEVLKILIEAFDKFAEKSDKKEMKISSVSKESNSFIVNNTFIFILKKDIENDAKPLQLIRRISDKLIINENSFIQLVGLEMQTIFNNNESFINESLLQSSTAALFAHRNYLKKKNSTDIPFTTLIKNILIEHATLRLRTSKLSLLEEEFLDSESPKYEDIPSDEEIASINTFYNCVNVQSLNDVDFPNVNFGDIFKDKNDNYYLCVTALCDCLNPAKIQQKYFFVKGTEIPIQKANILGDGAFISYVPNGKVISWINLESTKKNKSKSNNSDIELPPKLEAELKSSLESAKFEKISKMITENLKEKDNQINKHKTKAESLERFKYKPVYIQPHTYNIKNPKIKDNTIELRRVEALGKVEDGKDNGELSIFNVTYVTTLRPNYAQRIANHTFTHPVRVGIDFVSKP